MLFRFQYLRFTLARNRNVHGQDHAHFDYEYVVIAIFEHLQSNTEINKYDPCRFSSTCTVQAVKLLSIRVIMRTIVYRCLMFLTVTM